MKMPLSTDTSALLRRESLTAMDDINSLGHYDMNAGVSVREIMTSPIFEKSILYAGAKGLDSIVRKITVSDMLDTSEWLQGGEVVCTTGYAICGNTALQKKWLEDVQRSGAAAVIIKPDRFMGHISSEMVETAEYLSLPLIGVPLDVVWPNVIQETMDMLLSAQTKKLRAIYELHHKLDSLLLSSMGVDELLDSMKEMSGYDIGIVDDIIHLNPDGAFSDNARTTQFEFGENSCSMYLQVIAGKHKYGWMYCKDVALCDKDKVQMIMEQGASSVALACLSKYKRTQNRSEQINQFCKEMMTRKGLTHMEINHYATDWGVALTGTTVILRVFFESELSIKTFEELLDDVHFADKNCLVSHFKNSIIILFHPKSSTPQETKDDTRRFGYRLLSFFEKKRMKCHIGMGEPFTIYDCPAFARSFKEAEMCGATAMQNNEMILGYLQMGIMRIFPYIEELEAFEEMSQKLLKPLADEDFSLLDSLKAYIFHCFNKSQTAKSLNIHVNTLNYRLEKIQSILSMDLNDADNYILLYAAMASRSYFNWKKDNQDSLF